MKKTLVALAALAAFGSASAQVVLYGKVDLGLSSKTVSNADNAGLEVTDSNYEGSRIGIKAAHPLGGGLTAMGQYEMAVNADGGGALAVDRVATLGVAGSFGTVSLGLQWSPYDSAWGFDQLEYNGFSAANGAWYNGVHGDNGTGGKGNVKNSIAYTTPDIGGFNATILYANNKVAATPTAADNVPYIGLGANYAAGPLSVNFGYEQVASSAQLGAVAAAGEKTTAYIIGASYNLGVATVGIGFEQANVRAAAVDWKDAGYTLSVSAPVSATTTVALGYASETTTTAGSQDGKATSFGAHAIYNLTKQAAVYGGAVQTKATSILALANGEITTTKYAAGLRYNF